MYMLLIAAALKEKYITHSRKGNNKEENYPNKIGIYVLDFKSYFYTIIRVQDVTLFFDSLLRFKYRSLFIFKKCLKM